MSKFQRMRKKQKAQAKQAALVIPPKDAVFGIRFDPETLQGKDIIRRIFLSLGGLNRISYMARFLFIHSVDVVTCLNILSRDGLISWTVSNSQADVISSHFTQKGYAMYEMLSSQNLSEIPSHVR